MGSVKDCPDAIRSLHAELLFDIENVQDMARVSDTANFENLGDFLKMVESKYFYSREVSKSIRRFLKKHVWLRRKYQSDTTLTDSGSVT